ncbi:anti-sigma factor antagonist [Sorangium cellulosum]|uniref:Anti-sigma factor antagonist n=1 Tax=Sorangium cellulosum TaxID=56 RepID=A0A2L0EVL3_SORCE|nr:STAS domain-containing protein [Sorangium cellulosum]AUX43337.1 anti-sigma factor antagonist [Sorangium cellulosum]
MDNPKITIAGFDIEWDLDKGLNLWAGMPTLSMWIPSSVAGLMSGMVAMVGAERFNLCLQLGGRQSVDGDWSILSTQPTFEEGFRLVNKISLPAGWGRWEIVALDRERREARYRAYNNWESIYQRSLGVSWGCAMTAGKMAGMTERLFGVPCWAEQTAFEAKGDAYDEFLIRQTDKTAEARLAELLEAGRATSTDLAVALESLKKEVAERERTEAALREKLQLIQQQETALCTMVAPIIQVWDGVLTVPVMGGLDSQRASALMERLLGAIVAGQTRHVIIDLTAVDAVDTSTADHLIRIVRAVELLGARLVVTSIRPAVAQTVVSLGMDLGRITTLRDLQEGLKWCMAAGAGAQK